MQIPVVNYKLKITDSNDGKQLDQELAKFVMYKEGELSESEMRLRLMAGEIIFMLQKQKTDQVHTLVLKTTLTGRIPIFKMVTLNEASKIINEHNDLINRCFNEAGLGDRKQYDHLIVGVRDTFDPNFEISI